MTHSQPYNPADVEKKWQKIWKDDQVYSWRPAKPNQEVFSVDTPPPTVSGSLHIGHVFSYTHTDILARFQRMKGKAVYYPMGWDDNGLPTERRVQNEFGISCQAQLPYQPEWSPAKSTDKKAPFIGVSRQNFIEACQQLTLEDEAAFETLWRQLGLSVDWDLQYATIDENCRKTSQWSFLDLVEKGFVYQNEAPTMWDVTFKTAVAQAEIEDRLCPGAYHHIAFEVEGADPVVIATTRPELLPACIALVAHPDDLRYQPLFGKTATSPLFAAKIPIYPADHADPEKGTGILMVCTFGDATDVDWWKQSGLPIKQVLGDDGRFREIHWDNAQANDNYAQIKGLRINAARKKIIELLGPALIKPPEPIEHHVKFYEKGDLPIEFMTTRQWFIKILAHKEALLAQGEKINWHPSYMKTRYLNWVEGLNQDWCISRQRFFGVPFPVWYPTDNIGHPRYDAPLFATQDQLPVDPQIHLPKGYTEAQRNQPNGFIADPDVMDTWATSSLTPQLPKGAPRPMDVRPQSHEIIRTWAFYTIAKSWMHYNQIPWKNVLISGWILDPDRKKMSKSKGNGVTPEDLLDKHSSDAVRYWAARARLGTDTAFDESIFSIGKKLVTKLMNASKFVMGQLETQPVTTSVADITECIDKAWVGQVKRVIDESNISFENFDYAGALEKSEALFWKFCDHYIELVKGRAYQESGQKQRSALATLDWSLQAFLKLFAPVLPYVTEEVWSWRYAALSSSIHLATWPSSDELQDMVFPSWDDEFIMSTVISILSEVRGAKTKGQKSMKYPVESLKISGSADAIGLLEVYPEILEDLARAGSIQHTEYSVNEQSNSIQIEVLLSPAEVVEKMNKE